MANIMVTDDSKFMRMVIKKTIEEKGVHKVVAEASIEEEAVNLFKTFHPDLVTMDINMPGVKSGNVGIEWALRIREIDSSAKILIVTAFNQDTTIADAIKVGVTGFIVKPFDKEKLVETIDKILAK